MRKKRVGFVVVLALMFAVCAVSRADYDASRRATSKITSAGGGQCSAVCISPEGLMLTVSHCGTPTRCELDGRRYRVAVVARGKGAVDAPVLLQVQEANGKLPHAPLATAAPRRGEAVYSFGYPQGKPAFVQGRVTDIGEWSNTGQHETQPFIETDFNVRMGHSGGPLFNRRGEVVGLVAFGRAPPGDSIPQRNRMSVTRHSGHAPFTGASWVHTDTLRAVVQARRRRPEVVVFSSDDCGPCRVLERDVKAGHFRGYDFRFVKWNENTKAWSHPDLYREFWKACRPDPDDLAFPTVWVKGTDSYRVGYSAEQRGGLLNWIARAVKHLLEGIFGKREPIKPPIPDGSGGQPPPETKLPPANDTKRLIDKLLKDVAAARDEAKQTRSDLTTFKESGVVGKIKSIARLKSDKDRALERVEALKSDVERLRGKLREEPLQFLWGLLGILSGLVHRRFAH